MNPKAVPINKQSWLVLNSDGKSELLTKFRNTFTVTKDGMSSNLSLEQLEEHYKCDIFKQIKREPIKRFVRNYVGGIDINYDKPTEATIKDGFPVFRKYISDVFYCAGYFGIKYDTTYIPSFCPKLSTVNKYDHVGPYKSLDELYAAIRNSRS